MDISSCIHLVRRYFPLYLLSLITLLSGCTSLNVYTEPSGEPVSVCDGLTDDATAHADCAARVMGTAVADIQGYALGCRMRGEQMILTNGAYGRPEVKCVAKEEAKQRAEVASRNASNNSQSVVASKPASAPRGALPCDGYDGDEKLVCLSKVTGSLSGSDIQPDALCRQAGGRWDLQQTSRGYIKKCYRGRAERVSPKGLPDGAEQLEDYLVAKSAGVISAGSIRFGLSQAEWQQLTVASTPINTRGDRYVYLYSFEQGQPYTRGRAIGKAAVSRSDKLVNMPVNAVKPNECFAIADEEGNFYAIRSGLEGDAKFAFRHPINESNQAVNNLNGKLSSLSSQITAKKNEQQSVLSQLAKNQAYQGGSCVVLPTGKIPPEPKKLPERVVEVNAHGACMYTNGGAFGYNRVQNGLAAAGKLNIIRDYETWKDPKFPELSCAQFAVDPYDKNTCKKRNIIGMATYEWDKGCLVDRVTSCIAKAKNRCNGTWNQWDRQRRLILTKPARLKQACDELVQQKSSFNAAEVTQLESQLTNAKSELERAKQQASLASMLKVSDPRTFCTATTKM